MRPSEKHVLGVLEWSYVVPEKKLFKIRVWSGVTPSPVWPKAKFSVDFLDTFPKRRVFHFLCNVFFEGAEL